MKCADPAAAAWRLACLMDGLGVQLTLHTATMTHAAMSAEARAAAGIGDGLLRLSVGIEHADDLVADIAAALDRAQEFRSDKRRVAK